MAEHAPTKRVIDILSFLAKERRGSTLSGIARGIGSPVSTCAIILRTLSSTGFLDYDASTRQYSLGFGTYAISSAYLGAKNLLRMVVGEMHRIADALGEICELGVLSEGDVLFIAKVEPPDSMRTVSQTGVRMPACCTAAGKALLSDANLSRLRELYGRKLPAVTPHSLGRFEELVFQLKAVREGGVARNFRESNREGAAYGLPLRFRGRVAAGLSVALPIFRNSSEKEVQIAAELHKGQRRIEAIMESRGESLADGRWGSILPLVAEGEDQG